MFRTVGVIAGVDAEAAALFPGQSANVEALHGFMVRQVQFADRNIAITCSGIGKVNAAMAAMMLVEHYHADLLIVVGTAGKLNGRDGACFQIVEAVQGDYGASRADGFVHYRAGAWPIGEAHAEPFYAAIMPETGLPKVRVITSDCFMESAEHGERLYKALSGDIVDMETAAVAQAAARMDIPWAAIKAVSDDANGNSAGDFQANLKHVARVAAEAAQRMIADLPQG